MRTRRPGPTYFLSALALCSAGLGCETTIAIRGTVTVPPPVQARFSAERPGVVMLRTHIQKTGTLGRTLGLLCEPSNENRTFDYDLDRFGCAKESTLHVWVDSAPADDNLSCGFPQSAPRSDAWSQGDPTEGVAHAEYVLFRGNEPGSGCSSGEERLDIRLELLESNAATDVGVEGRGENTARWWDTLPRAAWSGYRRVTQSQPWFEAYDLGRDVFAIYEPGQFEEVISYLIIGEERALLFDTGLGIADIKKLIQELTARPIVVVNSHTHYDHVGGNHQFETIFNTDTAYTENNRQGRSHEEVSKFVSPGWLARPLPNGVSAERYEGKPWNVSRRLADGQKIDLGGRTLEVLVTPGHAPDSVCLLDAKNRMLFTGDTLYPAPLYVHLEGSNFADYRATAKRLAALESRVDWILPGHNEPRMKREQLGKLRDAFEAVQKPETPYVLTDGTREYRFERFSVIVREPPPWAKE